MARLVLNKEKLSILKEQDVILMRNRIKEYAVKISMTLLNQTKLITAASELVRNMLNYAGGGNVLIEVVSEGRNSGVRLTFADEGPGIGNIDKAMQDGYSTGRSMGLGLPGAKRLSNEFSIKSAPGKGTIITILRWKNGI